MSDTRDKQDRRAAYRERMKARGYVQVGIWIPRRDKARINAIGEQLRRAYEQEQQQEAKDQAKGKDDERHRRRLDPGTDA